MNLLSSIILGGIGAVASGIKWISLLTVLAGGTAFATCPSDASFDVYLEDWMRTRASLVAGPFAGLVARIGRTASSPAFDRKDLVLARLYALKGGNALFVGAFGRWFQVRE